jgi:hypothetical protein
MHGRAASCAPPSSVSAAAASACRRRRRCHTAHRRRSQGNTSERLKKKKPCHDAGCRRRLRPTNLLRIRQSGGRTLPHLSLLPSLNVSVLIFPCLESCASAAVRIYKQVQRCLSRATRADSSINLVCFLKPYLVWWSP